MARLRDDHALDERAARNLRRLPGEQREATGALPTDRTIVVERFRDELGDWRVVPAHAVRRPRPRAVGDGDRGAAGASSTALEVQTIWTDDGIALRLPEGDESRRLDEELSCSIPTRSRTS